MRRLPGTGDVVAEASPEFLPDRAVCLSFPGSGKCFELPELLSTSFVLARDSPTPGKFSTHISLPLGSDKSFFTSQGPGPCLEHPVLAPFLPLTTAGRISCRSP